MISEAAHQKAIIDLATRTGWRWYHVPDSRRCPPGFPDLVLVRGDQLFFVECKTDKGRLRPAQNEWLDALGHVREVQARVWRPRDWDEIERMLAGGSCA